MSVSLESIIYGVLASDPGVFALLGSSLYLLQLPENPVYPCATYQRISTVPITTMVQNAGWQQTGWSRFQITVWANSPTSGADTDAIARAIQAAMLSLNAGVNQGSPEVNVQAPNYLINRRMLIEPEVNPPLFKAMLDFNIFYVEQ